MFWRKTELNVIWPWRNMMNSQWPLRHSASNEYESVFKSFWIGLLDRELQVVRLSATRCSYIAILWVSLVSFAAIIPLCYFSTSVYCCKRIFRYRLSPETFGYILVRIFLSLIFYLTMHQLLVCATDSNLLGYSINTITRAQKHF